MLLVDLLQVPTDGFSRTPAALKFIEGSSYFFVFPPIWVGTGREVILYKQCHAS